MQWRAWVGPKFSKYTDAVAYNWAGNVSGSALARASGVLSTSISAVVTALSMTSIAGTWPGTGGAWIGPADTNEAWEYVDYSLTSATSLNNMIREPAATREHSGAHGSGAQVLQWFPLSTALDTYTVTPELNQDMTVITWTGEIHGVRFPQGALLREHLLVIEERSTPADAWAIRWQGFITNVQSSHDSRKRGEWTINFACLAAMTGAPVKGFRSGDFNLATGTDTSASDTMAAGWKERLSGDYSEANPDVSAGKMVDEDPATLWISERFLGAEPAHYTTAATCNDPMVGHYSNVPLSDSMLITEIHISLPAGQPDGYRYVELTTIGAQAWVGREAWLATDVTADFVDLKPMGEIAANKTIIICENETRFREENPAANPAYLIDLEKVGVPNLLKQRAVAGGALGIYRASSTGGVWLHAVAWGTGTRASKVSAVTGTLTTEYAPLMSGGTLAAATPGQTYRYIWANNATAKNNWQTSLMQTPGYQMDDGTKVWALCNLPSLGLRLRDNITATQTGAITLIDAAGAETTDGLDASGTIQIGDEQIPYTKLSDTQINITSRTNGVAHLAGDAIYVVDGGVMTDGYSLSKFTLKWRSGGIVAKNFTLRTNKNIFQARTPSEQGYVVDWDYSAATTNNAANVVDVALPTARRVRQVLVEFDLMSVDPARARLGELIALPATATFAQWFTGATASGMAQQILTAVGVPPAAISLGTTPASGKHGTEPGPAWDVLEAFANYAGLLVRVLDDSRISITTNPLRSASAPTIAYTWTPSNSRRFEEVKEKPEAVGQVKIAWMMPDGSAGSAVMWPTSAGAGVVDEIEDLVFASSAEALAWAKSLYNRRRYPHSYLIEAAAGSWTHKCGDVHQISGWKIGEGMQTITRTAVVMSIENSIERTASNSGLLVHKQVLHLIDITRDVA